MWKIAAFSRQYDRSPVPPHNVYLKQTAVLKLQDGGRPPSWKSKNFIFFFIGQVAWVKRDDEEWKKIENRLRTARVTPMSLAGFFFLLWTQYTIPT